MQLPLGFFLRRMRQSRDLSQAQAARVSGIGRVTLNRWETCAQQPRVLELESLLRALAANQSERRQALEMLGTPQARALLREGMVRAGEHRDIGPMPHGGDLLRALRTRQNWSQGEAAQRIGVAVRTLRRWEKSEVWPSPAQMQTLCYALRAHTEEMVALTSGPLSPTPESEAATLEEIEVCGERLYYVNSPWCPAALKELHYLALGAQCWPLVVKSGKGQQVLAKIYSYHANYLCCARRFAESEVYANRALDLLSQQALLTHSQLMAAITVASATVHRGARSSPQRGIQMLQSWLGLVEWPEYEAWMLSDMAAYTALVGDVESGLRLVRRAREVASRSDNPHELYNRERDEARLLLQAGKPRQALALIQRERPQPFLDHPARFSLLEAEAYLDLQEPSLAHDRLQHAQRLIEAKALVHLQPQAQLLARRV